MNWLDRKLYQHPRWRRLRGLPEPMTPEQAEMARAAMRMLGDVLEKASFARNVNKDYDAPLGDATAAVRIGKRD